MWGQSKKHVNNKDFEKRFLSGCKTVYPGSIPGVASSFSLPRKFRLGDLPRKAAAPSRGGRGLEKRLGIRGRASFALSVLLKPVRLCYSNALARERGSVPR